MKTYNINALHASSLAYRTCPDDQSPWSDDNTVVVLTKEFDICNYLSCLEPTLRRVAASRRDLFRIKTQSQQNQSIFVMSHLGEELFLAMRNLDLSQIEAHYPMHELNPYFEVFFKLLSGSRLVEQVLNLISCTLNKQPGDQLNPFMAFDPLQDQIKACGLLNVFVNQLRKTYNSTDFKKRKSDFKRTSNKNYRSLTKYIDQLFDHHARLLVIRIDLGYTKPRDFPFSDEINYIDPKDVKVHREKFIRFLNNQSAEYGLVGHAWKLEYGLHKSYHYHFLLLFDGSKVRQDVTIAKMLGERWKTITEDKGLYYNCNAYKTGYKYCGIGMINHSDIEMRKNLHMAALYMTKVDYYIRLALPGGAKTFGKGLLPKVKTKVGARRKSASDQTMPLVPAQCRPVVG